MRLARFLSSSLVFVLLGGAVAVLPPLPAVAAGLSVQDTSVPVSPVSGQRVEVADSPDAVPGPQLLPGGGSAEIAVAAPVTSVGGLPVDVQPGEPSEVQSLSAADDVPLAEVNVTVAAPSVAQALGVKGVVLAVSRSDGQTAEGRARLDVDYRSWSGLFGAGFGQRLRLVELPSCALSEPSSAACRAQTPVASSNASGLVSAEVTVPATTGAAGFAVASGFGAGPTSRSATENDLQEASQDAGEGAAVFAVTSGSSGANGDFKQTSLSPAGSWNAGSGSGSFTWSYPLGVPAGLGGPAPQLSLSYNSGSVDGRTHFTNGQASWVGEGWSEDLGGGFIERSYKGCNDDGSPTGDLCWYSLDNATISFQGQSSSLVKDPVKGWRTAEETGWRIELLTGTSNGDDDGEHWKITTLDGTQYFFGRSLQSAQTVPVYGNHSWEPGYSSAGFAASWRSQGYRWNLDYVIDPRGNTMSYFYSEWGNNYGANNNTFVLGYDAGSRLDRIEYGTTLSSVAGQVPFAVYFIHANRCVGSCTSAEFLDTPMDLHCWSSTSCSNNTSPTFWLPYRLFEVVAFAANSSGALKAVDKWALGHSYEQGTNSAPNLFLKSVTHTGYDENEAGLAENPVLFGEYGLANRIETTGSPNIHFRVMNIHNGTGGLTQVSYSGMQCPQFVAAYNPHRCYPQYTSAAKDDPAQWSWFNKYVVTKIAQIDETGGSPTETWNYSYSTVSSPDTSLWAHDEAEASTKRGWTMWKGYSDVTVTHGSADGTTTGDIKTSAVFHRGLNDDAGNDGWGTPLWRNKKASLASLVGTSNMEAGAIAGYSAATGICLGTAGGAGLNGTLVELTACTPGVQTWRYNWYDRNMLHTSGKCLDIAGGSAQHGATIQLFDCNSSYAQEWRWQTDGRLLNPYSGKCLGTTGHSITAGTTVKLYNCSGSYDQRWMPQEDLTLRLNTAARCMDVRSSGTADGTVIQSNDCNQTSAQAWRYDVTAQTLKNSSDDPANPGSGKCATASVNLLQLATCTTPTTAQKWVPQADGTLKNAATSMCLDATSTPVLSKQLTVATCNSGLLSQKFAHLVTDQQALAGKTRQTSTWDGATPVSTKIDSYQTALYGTRAAPPGTGTTDVYAWLVQATRSQNKTWVTSTATPYWRWTEKQTKFDTTAPVLPSEVKDFGDITPSVTSDDVCTKISYNITMDYPAFMVDYPREILTTTCDLVSGDGNILSGQHFYYDYNNSDATDINPPTRGQVTKTTALKQVTGGAKTWVQASRTQYDTTYGRPIKTHDALDRYTTTAYTQTPTWGPVRSIKTTNMLGHESTAALNHRSQPKSATDANGKVITATYDKLGRLVTVTKPGNTTALPDAEYGYVTPASPAASYTSAKALGPNGNQIVSYQTFDGWLRPRQTQTTAPDGKRVITDTKCDNRGLTVKTSAFYNNASAPAPGLVTPQTAPGQEIHVTYDGAGRQTKSELYSMGQAVAGHVTSTSYKGDRIAVTPPTGGTPTTTISDAGGKTVQLWQHLGAGTTAAHQATSYTYNRAGQLTNVTDPQSNTWIYEYDLLGRKTKSTDPDTGISTTVYDNAGQITSTADARGQQLHNEYDNLGRKTKIRKDTTAGTVLSSWTYDAAVFYGTTTPAKGQLTSATRHDTSGSYVSAVSSYDDGYRPKVTTFTAPGFGTGGGTLTYTTENTYKPNGAPATAKLPAAGDLATETLTHTYSDAGLPISLASGLATYVAASTYHYDGLVSQQRRGASGKQAEIKYDHSLSTRRLEKITTSTENAASPGTFTAKHVSDYTYDLAGNVRSVGTQTNGVADQVECFDYDALRRLTQAWTQASYSSGCLTPQKNGADPYWRTWQIDTIGNRTQQVDKNADGTAATTWAYQNGAAGGVKPHQVKQITAPGKPTRTFTYDPAGNTVSRTTETGTTQTLTWDAENHLATVTEGGSTVASYVYGPDGSRLLAVNGTTKTLYLPDGTELEKRDTGAILATRYIGGVAVRNTTGLKWTVANHQGSAIAQIDVQNLAVNTRRLMPYGEPRTTQPAGWFGTKGYIGGTSDAPTGLTHLGAREYDPTTGRFISPDPLMDFADPQQWHAYTYSNNNPTTWSDPDGLCVVDEEKGTCDRAADRTLAAQRAKSSQTQENRETTYCSSGRYPECFPDPSTPTYGIILSSGFVVSPDEAALRAALEDAIRHRCGDDLVCNSGSELIDATIRDDVCQKNPSWCGSQDISNLTLIEIIGSAVGYTTFGTAGRAPHQATVTIFDPHGNIIGTRDLRSGEMTAKERALGFPRSTLATHTEPKAMRIPMAPGSYMVIDGMYTPCTSCRGEMRRTAEARNVTIVYRWEGRVWVATPYGSGARYAKLARLWSRGAK